MVACGHMIGYLAQGMHLIVRVKLCSKALVDFLHNIRKGGKVLFSCRAGIALYAGKARLRRDKLNTAFSGFGQLVVFKVNLPIQIGQASASVGRAAASDLAKRE